ncbi:MAG: TolC family protein [Acidobacteria bacterium]|nr:TolC family protein [Acidobacteriota bacterium]
MTAASAASAQPPVRLQAAATAAPNAVAQASAEPAVPTALAALVAELEQNNPELKAARRDVDMRVARIAPAGALPDPTLSVGYMSGLARPPFFPSVSAPGSFRQFGASQELPYPGKLRLRTRVAATEADAERWNYETTRRGLIAELKDAYFEYVYVDRSLSIVQRNKERLDQFRQIAEARFSVGKAIQQDVIKTQVEISLLLERQALLEQQRAALHARINGLLFRAPDTPLGPALLAERPPFTLGLDDLRALVRESYPALKRDERVIDRGQQALALARREVRPDFAVSVTSQKFVGDMPWMYGVDVMVKVPLFWQRKQRPMIAEAAAALESGKQMRDNTLAMATAQVTEGYLEATTSQRLVTLYGDSVLPQARLALESSLASYQVGSVDFLSVLTNFITILDYELSYEEQNARFRQALARLEPLVARELVR